MTSKSDLLTKWYQEVWAKGNLDIIDELFAPEMHADGLMPDMQIGPDEFKILVATILELVEPPKIEVRKTVEQGDWVSAFVTMETLDLSGRHDVRASAMVFARFDNGKMVEAYNLFDTVSFFETLGLLPDNTMALLFSGQKLQ